MKLLTVQKAFSDFWTKHWTEELPSIIIGKVITFLIIVAVTYIFIKLTTKAVRSFFRRTKGTSNSSMVVLLNNIIKYGSLFISAMIILKNVLNVDTSAILATAGVASVAIGFGAQSLVKDIITGFFILLENYYSVGDSITLDGHTGTVEYLGLRSTKIRTFSGDLYNIPNGEVKTVLNHARGSRNIIIDIPVAYEYSLDEIVAILKPVFENVTEKIDGLTEAPSILGISKLGETSMSVRVTASCKEGTQFAAERELLGLIKKTFDEKGIEIPHNKLLVMPQK